MDLGDDRRSKLKMNNKRKGKGQKYYHSILWLVVGWCVRLKSLTCDVTNCKTKFRSLTNVEK